MKNVLKSKFLWASAFALSLGIAGCNIFNPTESINIKDKDAQALTYEGYKKIRNNEYTEAEYYFNKAILADSNYSEAWLGLMKATLNRKLNDESTNLFSLLSYVNASREAKAPFVGMPDSVAARLKEAVDTVNVIADKFLARDKAGKTDSLVTFKTISQGYTVLQMMNAMLILRDKTASLGGCSLAKNQENSCDMATVLNDLKDDPGEIVETFGAVFKSCEENPESMTTMFDGFIQGFDLMKEDAKKDAVGSMCGALVKETEDAGKDEDAQTKTLNIIISQFAYSDISDDDGDGCVDEELYDGEDNDGDGEIDEDVSDKTNEIKYNNTLILQNVAKGKNTIADLRVITEAKPNHKYTYVDIDMNGKTVCNPKDTVVCLDFNAEEQNNEWNFIYPDYKERIAAQTYTSPNLTLAVRGDHRLKFAAKLVFNPKGYPYDEYLAYKKEVAKDTDINNIKFNLTYRKDIIGGCWKYYDEDMFKKWFEGRSK